MSPNPYAERRPGGVTFVIALTWIVAFLSIISGFLTLMGKDSPVAGTAVDAGQPAWYDGSRSGSGSSPHSWPSAWPRAAASPDCW